MRKHLISNHLSTGYSDFVLSSLKKISSDLSVENSKIIDAGCGQCRHLKLLKFLGFKKANLFGLDKIEPKNHKNFCQFIKCDIEKGINFPDQFFDLVLANFLLMYIDPEKSNSVIFDLLRITAKYLIIETNAPQKGASYMYSYDFKKIVKSIEQHKEFQTIQVRNSLEKLLVKRI